MLFFPARTGVRRGGILLRFCPARAQTRRRPLCGLQVRKTPGADAPGAGVWLWRVGGASVTGR